MHLSTIDIRKDYITKNSLEQIFSAVKKENYFIDPHSLSRLLAANEISKFEYFTRSSEVNVAPVFKHSSLRNGSSRSMVVRLEPPISSEALVKWHELHCHLSFQEKVIFSSLNVHIRIDPKKYKRWALEDNIPGEDLARVGIFA